MASEKITAIIDSVKNFSILLNSLRISSGGNSSE